jgi:hypothetical protein
MLPVCLTLLDLFIEIVLQKLQIRRREIL